MDTYRMDTPMLRMEYGKLQQEGVALVGCSARHFNALVRHEMEEMGIQPSPRNWVAAAEELVRFLYAIERLNQEG